MLDLGDILRLGSPSTPDGEPPGDDGTCGDCADGKCHGTDPDDCECARHDASIDPDRDDEADYRCCALDEGHDGPCAWICHHCQGTGVCPDCDGSGDDGSGLDYTCTECGGGPCPHCEDGLETDDTYIGGVGYTTVHLPDQDVT